MKFKVIEFSYIELTLFLIGMLILTFNIQPVEASGTIYIRPDGSVDPQTAPISSTDNVTYIFTGNIHETIVVQRDNIVVDGAGYTLQGSVGYEKGIDLTGRSNITISNMEIRAFAHVGIELRSSSNNIIFGNNVTNSYDGVHLYDSSNNSIYRNDITGNYFGISLSSCFNNSIYENNVKANTEYGINLYSYSSYNNVFANNIEANIEIGIEQSFANYNNIFENNITENRWGLGLFDCSNNKIYANNITDNHDGIYLHGSLNNSIYGNSITKNLDGITLSRSSNYNNIFANNITDHIRGVLFSASFNNTFYHNYFINNYRQIYDYSWEIPPIPETPPSINIWDDGYPSGGNYWSDYVDVDEKSGPNQDQPGSDGIWDHPYVIYENNQDSYPLWLPPSDTTPPTVSILSPENKTYTTSSVSLSFTVDEATSWIGYSLDGQVNVTIAGNTTLSGLSDGSHSLIVYANDTAGNTGASEIVYFGIKTQEGKPFPMWIVAAIVIIAVVGPALLVYFTKVK